MEDFSIFKKIGERIVDEHISIKEENFRLRQIVDNDFVISFVIDTKGDFILPNKKSLQLLGYKSDKTKKLKTRNAFKFFQKSPKAIENIKKALNGEHLTDVLKLDNKYWKVNYQPIYDEDQQLIAISGLSVDITDILKNPTQFLID